MQKIKDELLTLLIEHSRIIYSIVSDMGVYYSGWSENYEAKKDSFDKKKGKMQLSEEEGDTIKAFVSQSDKNPKYETCLYFLKGSKING